MRPGAPKGPKGQMVVRQYEILCANDAGRAPRKYPAYGGLRDLHVPYRILCVLPIDLFCPALPYLPISVDAFSESGERLAHCQINTFVRGAGGFGGHRNSDLAIATVSTPSRPPDGSTTETIGIDQVTGQIL